MDIPVIYQDQYLLAVNKPPGVVVNRAETVKTETVTDWVSQTADWFDKFRDRDDDFSQRCGIVHRIDKETSGILLIAKDPDVFASLQHMFQNHEISKEYQALAHGKIVPDRGQVNAPVGRLPWNREQFGIVPGGKESLTVYEVIRHLQVNRNKHRIVFTHVRLFPKSGRTHQIRVHLKYLGFPILGDYLYAGRKVSRDDRTWIPRVMLHASGLSCTHPVSGQELQIQAPIPDDMQQIINQAEDII